MIPNQHGFQWRFWIETIVDACRWSAEKHLDRDYSHRIAKSLTFKQRLSAMDIVKDRNLSTKELRKIK